MSDPIRARWLAQAQSDHYRNCDMPGSDLDVLVSEATERRLSVELKTE